MWVDGIPVTCILDSDQVLTERDIDEVKAQVRVCIAAGLVAPPEVRDARAQGRGHGVPDPGAGSSARGRAPRPWAGPGTKGYRRP